LSFSASRTILLNTGARRFNGIAIKENEMSNSQWNIEHRKHKIILIVEDSPTQAIQLKVALLHNGLEVFCAVNGRMGIRMAQELLPDVVILDVQMPEVDGYEVARTLKAIPDTMEIPIIMLTRQDTPEAVQLGIEAGVMDYIPKDVFAHGVLIETLRQMGIICAGVEDGG
jgi:PleD family two-component response regulator